jgi:signal transduction histidine kinase
MIGRKVTLPPFVRSLSARLLVLTAIFVMVSEVLIFVPSVARFRLTYLQQRLADAHIAILALEATPDNSVSHDLATELLEHVGAYGIVLHKPNATMMLDAEPPPRIDVTCDLRTDGLLDHVWEVIEMLAAPHPRVMRVLDTAPRDPRVTVEVLLNEGPMRAELLDFASRVLQLSVVISLVTGALVYLALQWLLVTPLRRLTGSMVAFRANPEDASRVIVPSKRGDEVGLAERELAVMQETVRQALRHNARLAALGTAVTKINHDLRNILSTARLMSDSLADSEAPEVKRVTPSLLAAIDRAVDLCTGTLSYTREGAPPLRRSRFALAGLVEEIAEAVELKGESEVQLVNQVTPGLTVEADRDQLFRVIMNLAGNAVECGAHRITVGAQAGDDSLVIDVADNGPGLPPKARDNLFRPFAGSARPGGTGLGLAIAREIMRAHGGDIILADSSGTGTAFCLRLPQMADETAAEGTSREPSVVGATQSVVAGGRQRLL